MKINLTLEVNNFPTARLILDQTYDHWYNVVPEDWHDKFLRIANTSGWSIAHELASRGFIFNKDPNILKIKNMSAWSVAHEMANQGYKFTDVTILTLTDHLYQTVQDIMDKYGQPAMYCNCEVMKDDTCFGYTIGNDSFKVET